MPSRPPRISTAGTSSQPGRFGGDWITPRRLSSGPPQETPQPLVRDAVPGAELEPELRHPFETLPRRPGLGGGKFDFVENFDAAAGNRRAENAGALGSADVKAEEEIFFH